MAGMYVASTSAVLKPGAARSAATVPAGFPERATFEASHRSSDRWRNWWGADWLGEWGPDYQLSIRQWLA